MDIESKETIEFAIQSVQQATDELLGDAFVKIEAIIRDALAEVISGLDGWQIAISPINIRLTKGLKNDGRLDLELEQRKEVKK